MRDADERGFGINVFSVLSAEAARAYEASCEDEDRRDPPCSTCLPCREAAASAAEGPNFCACGALTETPDRPECPACVSNHKGDIQNERNFGDGSTG